MKATDHIFELEISKIYEMLEAWEAKGCPSDTLLLVVRKSENDKPLTLVDFRFP